MLQCLLWIDPHEISSEMTCMEFGDAMIWWWKTREIPISVSCTVCLELIKILTGQHQTNLRHEAWHLEYDCRICIFEIKSLISVSVWLEKVTHAILITFRHKVKEENLLRLSSVPILDSNYCQNRLELKILPINLYRLPAKFMMYSTGIQRPCT